MTTEISEAHADELDEILALQRRAFTTVAERLGIWELEPLRQTPAQLHREFGEGIILKYTEGGWIVGSVRAAGGPANDCRIGKLIVDPACRGRGIGTALMHAIERRFADCSRYVLFTGADTPETLRLYTALGYTETTRENTGRVAMIFMEKAGVQP